MSFNDCEYDTNVAISLLLLRRFDKTLIKGY